MTSEELNAILKRHGHWLNEDCEGWEDMRADLRGADLRMADLRGAYLRGAYLSENTKGVHMAMACPSHGAFFAWKAAGGFIVELIIPEDARRSSATTMKCRADKARVVDIQTADGSSAQVREVASDYRDDFIYKVGETVRVDDYDENRWNECSTGIHFFVDREEAVAWLNR